MQYCQVIRKNKTPRHLTKERRKKHCAFCTLNLNHKKKIRNTMNLNPYRRSENTTCIKKVVFNYYDDEQKDIKKLHQKVMHVEVNTP